MSKEKLCQWDHLYVWRSDLGFGQRGEQRRQKPVQRIGCPLFQLDRRV